MKKLEFVLASAGLPHYKTVIRRVRLHICGINLRDSLFAEHRLLHCSVGRAFSDAPFISDSPQKHC